MKKHLLLLLALASITLNFAVGGPVDRETASLVAKNFCLYSSAMKNLGLADLSLAYTEKSIGYVTDDKSSVTGEFAVFYIFNVNQKNGFVIVAADDDVTPVLGYATSGSYAGNNLPAPFRKLLELYKDQIRYIVMHQLEADDAIKNRWNNLENGRPQNEAKNVKTVSPLLATSWNQSPYENEMCPEDNAGPGGHCVTGCPATAMAQIMKYWNYPATGTGFHSYNASNSNGNYGTLSADFGSTSYDWGNMPNYLSGSSPAVALLMLHCGVAVEMNYGPNGSGGWVIASDQNGSHPNCSEIAYKTYFGYQASLQGLMRNNYSDDQWKQMLKTDLDAGRPVQYAGWGTGGHTFVCDGYDQNDYFDMNWGWGGQANGFYDLDGLNPGTDDFNSNQQAVFGIQPEGGSSSSSLTIYDLIAVSPDPITYGQGFTVHTNIENTGSSTFLGDYCAALFTSDGTFIDFIATLTESTGLPAGYHYTDGLDFTTTGIAAATPGDYIIGIYSCPAGGGWTAIAAGSYPNTVNVTINGSANFIALYSDIVLDRQPVVGQPFTATVDIINGGSSSFTGDFSMDLHASDGTWLLTIQEYDNQTLDAGYYFDDVPFSTYGLDVDPGDYYLVVWDRPQGGDWELVGSSAYSNPITVSIVGQPLSPDSFEPDNSESTARAMSVNFSDNTAVFGTQGSNIHSSDDVDYYKFDLPAGYYYFIYVKVDDGYNDPQYYTADVMFNFKTGGKWSDSYDSQFPSAYMTQGGSFVFNVFPYFPGEIGTYQLDFYIYRSVTGIDDAAGNNKFVAFPNPAKSQVTFGFELNHPEIISGYITNLFGQKVLDIPKNSYPDGPNSIITDVSSLAPGYYFYKFESDSGKVTGKLVITR